MASILELVHESSAELKDRARETEDVKVSLPKAELMEALAEEQLSAEGQEILESTKAELQEMGEDLSGTKAEIQEELLERSLSGESVSEEASANPSDGIWPARGPEGVPQKELESHFDTVANRRRAINDASEQARKLALENQQSYVVLESLKPSDGKEPMKVQPAYMKRHPDEILVFEARVPMSPYPVANAEANPVARLS